MFALTLIVAVGILFLGWHRILNLKFELMNFISALFLMLLIINLLVNNYALPERIFGVSGRATGFLTLSCFVLLFLITRNMSGSIKVFLIYLALANIAVSLYFTAQLFDYDFFEYQEFYGAPSSTLGNPNFVAGFIGFSSVALLDLSRRLRGKKWLALFFLTLFLFNLWVISETKSIQGFVSLGVGTFVYSLSILYLRFPTVKWNRLFPIFLVPIVISSAGFFGLGPLSTYLSSTTVYSRLDYWRAAMSMAWDNPLSGVGLDAYGDYYRFYRDENAISRFGEGVTADSAHNVYLDMFSYGGFPLGLTFIALNLVPVAFLLKRLRTLESQNEKRDQIIMAALWFSFQVQTVISVNQIGVSIWIWIILGLMAKKAKDEISPKRGRRLKQFKLLVAQRSLLALISITILNLSYLPLKANLDFVAAAKRSDGLELKNLVQQFPQDSKLIALVASGFQASSYSNLALGILKEGVSHNPNSFFLWKAIYENPNTSEEWKRDALAELKRIDPRFPYLSP
jgi:O-antigen ligase